MTLIEDSKEGQSESANYYCTGESSCVGSDIGTGSWSMSTHRMSVYASANSCVDRLNTEGSRDPAFTADPDCYTVVLCEYANFGDFLNFM